MFREHAKRFTRLASGIIAGMLIAVSVAGCSLLPEEETTLAPPLVKPREDNVDTVKIKRGTIAKYVRGVGTFESTSVTYHSLAEPGVAVEKVLVRSGDKVHKGDVLIQFQVGDLDLEIQQNELGVKYAEKNLNDALKAKDEEMVDIRRLELEIAKTKLKKTKEKLADTQLLAQVDGQITFVEKLERGEWLGDNRTLVTIADPTKLRLTYEAINRAALNGVKVGMSAEFDYKDSTYTGIVTQTPDSAPVTLIAELAERYAKTLYIEADQLPKEAGMGALADVRILTEKRDDTLIIPKGALRSYFGRSYVQVMEGESRKEVDVEVGIQTPTEVEIVSGLKDGQTLILQ